MHSHAGWVYVAFVIDCFSHRIVSWSAATSKSTDLVMDAVRMATAARAREGRPLVRDRLIHHSDAGSQLRFKGSLQHRPFLVGLRVAG